MEDWRTERKRLPNSTDTPHCCSTEGNFLFPPSHFLLYLFLTITSKMNIQIKIIVLLKELILQYSIILCQSIFQYVHPFVFQLLDDCSSRLKMVHPARTLYTPNGEPIQSWDDIERDMVICVSTGHGFITQKGTGDRRNKAFSLFCKELAYSILYPIMIFSNCPPLYFSTPYY